MADQSSAQKSSPEARSLADPSRDGVVVALLISIIVAAATGSILAAGATLAVASMLLLAIRGMSRRD